MARVHTQTKTRRGKEVKCGRCGAAIEPGEKYHSWSFRYGGAHYRCELRPPKPSELTQSKMSTVLAAIEDLDGVLSNLDNTGDFDEAKGEVRAYVETVQESIEEVKGEYEEAAEHFGGGGPNQELAEQMEACYDEVEDILSTIDQLEVEEADSEEEDTEEDQDARREQAFQELTDAAERVHEVSFP